MNIPANLLYTQEHEWIRVEGEVAVVGITDYAQGELGEIVYVEVETLDETLDAEAEFGAIEAVKTTSDLFMPVSGTVVAFNEALEENPELVNEDPYGKGWIIKIQLSDPSQLEDLLSDAAYEAEIG